MTILWFGIAAFVIGGLLLLFSDLELTWQLFIWALLSGWLTFLWFQYFKPLMADRTKAGISREAMVGETGHVISAPGVGRRGVIRFSKPLLGSDEWPFICDQAVSPGDRVVVRDISGNTLIVEKKH
jgi:membrane protein implicated in regulation of membrane protease activity